MRRFVRLMVGAAVVASSVGIAAPAGAATVDQTCSVYGSVYSTTVTDTPQPVAFQVRLVTSCSDGGYFYGKLMTPSAYCSGNALEGAPASGRLIFENEERPAPPFAKFKVHLTITSNVSGSTATLSIRGKETAGTYAGDKIKTTRLVAQEGGQSWENCAFFTVPSTAPGQLVFFH